MWGDYAKGSGNGSSAESQGFVEEGGLKVMIFSENHTRLRFLTEDISVEDLMAQEKMTREEATDALYTKVSRDRWIFPISYWEHQIKEIPGTRFFATAACRGRSNCAMCDENNKAKESGITENKFLPYPVRKRFLVPAFVYDLGMVVFIRGSDQFFDAMAVYLNQHGSAIDFEVWKTGKGLNTEYKSMYLGPAQLTNLKELADTGITWPAPKDTSLIVSEVEVAARMKGGKQKTPTPTPVAAPAQRYVPPVAAPAPAGEEVPHYVAGSDGVATPSASNIPKKEAGKVVIKGASAPVAPTPSGDAGSFEVTFGSHKGMTLRQLYDLGEEQYIDFLAKNSAGQVKAAATEFLAAMVGSK